MTGNTPDLSPVVKAAMERNNWLAAADMEMDRVWPMLEPALRHGMPEGIVMYTLDDLKQRVFSNDAQLWTTPNGACLTCVTVYPQTTIVQIWLMGGDFEELMTKHSDAVYRWAKDTIGASMIYVQGRKGWTRRLKGRGFTEGQSITCMELANYGSASTGHESDNT